MIYNCTNYHNVFSNCAGGRDCTRQVSWDGFTARQLMAANSWSGGWYFMHFTVLEREREKKECQ